MDQIFQILEFFYFLGQMQGVAFLVAGIGFAFVGYRHG